MTGMAAMYRVAALRDVKRVYGEVYDPDNWTEDWKLTIALKHLRWGMVRPQDCLATCRTPVRRGSGSRVLVLTTYDTDSHVLPAIEAGATGYLLKDAPRAELLRAVRATARGEAVLSPSVAARLMSRFRAPGTGPLSQRTRGP